MSKFDSYLKEDIDKKKIILDMWRDSADIEDIIKATKLSKIYIKNYLKSQNRKGWENI